MKELDFSDIEVETPEQVLDRMLLENSGGLVIAAGNEIFCASPEGLYLVASRDNSVFTLCSHVGLLYDGGDYCAVFDTLDNKQIASRDDLVLILCSHAGNLYDGGAYNGVFDTLNDPEGKHPLWEFDSAVQAIESVPMALWEQLAAKGKKVKK